MQLAALRDRDPEYADALVRFWSGDPLATPELRRRLKAHGRGPVSLPPAPVRKLALQRLRFAAKLLEAAGYPGWVGLGAYGPRAPDGSRPSARLAPVPGCR